MAHFTTRVELHDATEESYKHFTMRNPLKSAIRSGNKKPLSHSANSLSQTML
jgi:hypothetical protein